MLDAQKTRALHLLKAIRAEGLAVWDRPNLYRK
jgi:hypothetical protein